MEKSALATTFHQTMLTLVSLNLDAPGAQEEMITSQIRIADAIASLSSTAKGVRLDLIIELPCGGKDILVDFSGINATAVATLAILKLFTKL